MALPASTQSALDKWHEIVETKNMEALGEISHPEAVFRSPMAHTPYHGAFALALALSNVIEVFQNFTYHRSFYSEDGYDIVLEFSADVNDKKVKGADFIKFNKEGQIVEFEVMVRPMSGLAELGKEMGARIGMELKEHAKK